MKIGFFVDTFDPQVNGVTVSVNNLVDNLSKDGHEVFIFAPKIKNFKDKKKNVYRIPSFPLFKIEPEIMVPYAISKENLKQFQKFDFDIIHGHGNGGISFIGFLVARYKKVPFVMTFHSLLTKYTHHVLLSEKKILPALAAYYLRVNSFLCDAISTPSEKMKNELIKFGVKKKITVIPNFINLKDFQLVKRGYLRKKLNIKEDEIILVSVGRLDKAKSFEFLIRTFAKYKYLQKRATLVIVGQGPELPELMDLSNKLKAKKVLFTGFIDPIDMPKVYKDSDIFIFSSKSETQGISVLEAGAAGLPLVLVKDKAFSGMIEDGVNGFLVEEEEKKFAEKVSQLMENKGLREKFGTGSKKLIQKNFDPKFLTKKFEKLYTDAINEKNRN